MPPYFWNQANAIIKNNFLRWAQRGVITANASVVFGQELFSVGTPVLKYNRDLEQTLYTSIATFTAFANACSNTSYLFLAAITPSNALLRSSDGSNFSNIQALSGVPRGIACNPNGEVLIGYTTGRRSWSSDNGTTKTDVVIAGNVTEHNGVVWLPSVNRFAMLTSTGYVLASGASSAANAIPAPYPGGTAFMTICDLNGVIFACNSSAVFYKSTDNGATWSKVNSCIDSSATTLQMQCMINFNGTIYAAGGSGNILKYNPNSDSFVPAGTCDNGAMHNGCVYFNNLFVFTNTSGFVYRTLFQ